MNSSTVFEEPSNFRKLFCFHHPSKSAISRQPTPPGEALNYIPVFTPPATQDQKFLRFLKPANFSPPPTTLHHSPSSKAAVLSAAPPEGAAPCSEALDYSTVSKEKSDAMNFSDFSG
ncbi:hypothetical protein [Paracidovorax sp. MALMAid1276]|uniref:hypothetical protein n=1 Tax=Paracidovorax sp. MALMAid1276 TaxID=3411631 RepID=UPI003B9D4BC7